MSYFPSRLPDALRRVLRIASVAAILAALLVAAGCNQYRDERRTVGVTLLTREHFFYQSLQAALEKAADRQGYRLIISAAEWDLARQEGHIENFVGQRVDAILVCPVHSKGIGPAIEKANTAGIPVFTADIRAESGSVVSHVGSDNYLGGKLAGEFLAKALGGRGKVGILERPEVESAAERVRGFEDAVKESPGIQVVSRSKGDGTRDRAREAAKEMLRQFPDLTGMFAINDPKALGALAALESLDRSNVVVVGFDGDPEALAVLAQGSPLQADVEQNPAEIGATVMDLIHRYLNGEQVPKAVSIPVTLREAARQGAASR